MVLRAGVLRIRSAPKGSDLAVLYIFAVGTEVTLLANCKLKMLDECFLKGKLDSPCKTRWFRIFLCFDPFLIHLGKIL